MQPRNTHAYTSIHALARYLFIEIATSVFQLLIRELLLRYSVAWIGKAGDGDPRPYFSRMSIDRANVHCNSHNKAGNR